MSKSGKTPIVILNYKTYLESTGKNAIKLTEYVQEVNDTTGIKMGVAAQTIDITKILDNENIDIPIYAQHTDPITPGSHTGHVLPEALVEYGVSGTLINHSEKRMLLADIGQVTTIMKEMGLKSIICTNDVATSAAVASFNPDYIAVEPPELIGTGIPVSKANPEIVSGTVNEIHKINENIPVLCGAGISTGEDMVAARDLGSDGVLLASGIIKADNQKQALLDLVELVK
ncbi:MAG: triose-phosphate isomerase [Methanobacteriaceae archaeon]|nr:triose-phosphate isomerase [Methanobacteriaceae archaeon]